MHAVLAVCTGGVLLLLGACATSPQGRAQLTVPIPVSDAYSEVDMRLQLATIPTANRLCTEPRCENDREFDERVRRLGERLAAAAFDLYPDLVKRVSQFSFSVAEKAAPGCTSTGSGKVVVFRGVQSLGVGDETLALLIAREMGHVIGRHHDENSATRLLFSVLAGVLFPAANLFSGSTAAAQATSVTSATTFTTTAASTATSLVGSQIVLASIKPEQLNEADTIALRLVEALGWSRHEIIAPLESGLVLTGKDTWSDDMRDTMKRLIAFDAAERAKTIVLGSSQDNGMAEPEAELAEVGDSEEILPAETAFTQLEIDPPPSEIPALEVATAPAETPVVAETAFQTAGNAPGRLIPVAAAFPERSHPGMSGKPAAPHKPKTQIHPPSARVAATPAPKNRRAAAKTVAKAAAPEKSIPAVKASSNRVATRLARNDAHPAGKTSQERSPFVSRITSAPPQVRPGMPARAPEVQSKLERPLPPTRSAALHGKNVVD